MTPIDTPEDSDSSPDGYGVGVPTAIGIQRLRELLDDGAQLVEVLPPEEYGEEHLPGAINIPLRELTAEAVASLDRGSPVVVYCWDAL